MTLPEIVSEDEWIAASKELLAKEKAFTRQRDALFDPSWEDGCPSDHVRGNRPDFAS